jgi:hypothetical protein
MMNPADGDIAAGSALVGQVIDFRVNRKLLAVGSQR